VCVACARVASRRGRGAAALGERANGRTVASLQREAGDARLRLETRAGAAFGKLGIGGPAR
jgi:hypothetical protein